MILEEKVPPPPYSGPLVLLNPRSITALPPYILLQIVYKVFGSTDDSEKHRTTLYWLSTSLRLVNKSLYTACMHVLRSTYLQSYQSMLRSPYSSDPFPTSSEPVEIPVVYPSPTQSTLSLSSSVSARPSITSPLQRETSVLDKFIAFKVREDVFADDSELHLEREGYFRDLFEIEQPRARLEDLVRIYGVREGVVYVRGQTAPLSPSTACNEDQKHTFVIPPSPPVPSSPGSSTPQKKASKLSSFFKRSSPLGPSAPPPVYHQPAQRQIKPISFSSLAISFQPRKVGLVMNRSRTIVEIPRTPGRRQTLESLAYEVVDVLKDVLNDS